MKILHIAPTPFFADRGCHMRILGEIKELSISGFDVFLSTYHLGRDIEGIKTFRIPNIPWYKKLDAGGSWHKLYLDILLFFTCLKVYLRTKPDIIHGHLHEGALLGKSLSFIMSGGRTPVVFDVQGSLTGELEEYGFFKKKIILKKIFYWLEKKICKMPDYFVCSSKANYQFLLEKLEVPPGKIKILPDGIFPQFFDCIPDHSIKKKLGIDEVCKIVIYSGSLLPSKGIDYFLEAIPRVVEKYRNVHFVIIGYPLEYCSKKLESFGVLERVSLIGKTDFFKLPSFLSISDVAVDPKLDKSGEGSGKIMNYMGSGLPIVCFDTVNNRNFLGEKGFYAKAGDYLDLAKKIVEALSKEELARFIGRKNKEKAMKEYSWKASGEVLTEVYHLVTDKS